jgi:glutathione synthase/RimK-type ligase-like ATP-grasp enzyme
VRLAGDLAGFQRDGVGTVGKALLDRIQHKNSFRQNIKAGTAIMAVPACSASLRSIWRKAHRAIGMTRTGAW